MRPQQRRASLNHLSVERLGLIRLVLLLKQNSLVVNREERFRVERPKHLAPRLENLTVHCCRPPLELTLFRQQTRELLHQRNDLAVA